MPLGAPNPPVSRTVISNTYNYYYNGNQNSNKEILKAMAQFREAIMTEMDDFAAALKKVDVETTRVGQLIKELVDKLANGGLTTEQEAEVLAALKAAGSRLETVGSDVSNPVPDPV